MNEKVLVVEDETVLRETISYNLTRQGYSVDSAADGQTALQKARQGRPDLILLDIMLPLLDGFEVCRILRGEMNVPILMLTARDDETDRVVGLEIGADDYITKPFSMRELMARVKAQLRRIRMDHSEPSPAGGMGPKILAFGDLELDLMRKEMRRSGEALAVKPKEFELMFFLAQHRGEALTREFILERVWGWDFVGGSRTVDVHVRWLREKIEDNPASPARIVTVRGSGYRFEG